MDIRTVDIDTIWQVRQQVMYPQEQISYVQLPEDSSGKHLGLYIGGKLGSIGSLFERGNDIQFRKFATLVEEQGKGYGSQLLGHVMQQAGADGKQLIWCNARVSASGFMKSLGCTPPEKVGGKKILNSSKWKNVLTELCRSFRP